MDNVFHFLCFFLSTPSQGSDKVRDIPWPEELVFTVDQKIMNEIGCTKELYYKKVEFLAASLVTGLGFFACLFVCFFPQSI